MEFLLTSLAFITGYLLIPYIFWPLLVICFFWVALSIDDSRNGGGWGTATLGSAAIVYLAGSYLGMTIADVKANPFILLWGAGGYVVAGVLWSFAKWYFKLINVRDRYQELKASFIKMYEVSGDWLAPVAALAEEATKEEKQLAQTARQTIRAFHSHVSELHHEGVNEQKLYADPSGYIMQQVKPQASNNKSSITQWIAFWPISLTWTIINDPVRKLANWIFSRIKSVYGRMSDSIFAGVK